MNKKKILTSVGLLSAVVAPIIGVVSCGGSNQGNPWASKKEIVIAVDGAQKRMYDKAIELFNKTDAHTKDGYKIKVVDKDVWGALDVITTVGFTDESAPDLIYMPQDRLTGMLQNRVLMPMKTEDVNEFMTDIGATSSEKKDAIAYGSASFRDKSYMFGLPHNKEGIVIASKKPVNAATREELDKGVLTLQNEAKGLFRLQDLWYGSALFAKEVEGEEGKTAADYILYGDRSSWHSGFIIPDKDASTKQKNIHNAFKSITDSMADMWFEPLMKAYHKEATKLIGPEWTGNAIADSDLKNFFNNDMGAVHNTLLKQVSDDNLDYMYIGTWDAQNLAEKDIRNIFNPSHKLSSGSTKKDFIQAAGTWSYGINARNNGAEGRQEAIYQFLANIYDASSFTEYYEQDSKIPYFGSLQGSVKTEIIEGNKKINDAVKTLYNDQLFQKFAEDSKINLDTNKTKTEDIIAEMSRWFQVYAKSFNGLKNYEVSKDWLGKLENIAKQVLPEALKEAPNPYDMDYKDTIGIKDLLTEVLGIVKNTEWKILLTDLKDDIKNLPEYNEIKEGGDGVHVRKLQKMLMGFNGDNKAEKDEFTSQFAIDLKGVDTKEKFISAVNKAELNFNKVVKNLQDNKLSSFSNKLAKSPITIGDDKKAALKNYLNNLWNENLKDAQYKFIESNGISTIEFNVTGGKKSYKIVEKTITDGAKTLTLNKIFDLITSTEDDARTNNLGTFETQTKRFDRINPQFTTIWGLWNDQTFGSKVFLTGAINDIYEKHKGDDNKIAAENAFKKLIEERLSKLFKEKTGQLESGNSIGVVDLDQ